jgi:hypothetical protein
VLATLLALSDAAREGPKSERRAFIQALLTLIHCFGQPEFCETTDQLDGRNQPRKWDPAELDDSFLACMLQRKCFVMTIDEESIAYDMHTRVGKQNKRKERHFATESAVTRDGIQCPLAKSFWSVYTQVKIQRG